MTTSAEPAALRLYRDRAVLWCVRLFCLGLVAAGWFLHRKRPGFALLLMGGPGAVFVASLVTRQGSRPRLVIDAEGIRDHWLGNQLLPWAKMQRLCFAGRSVYVTMQKGYRPTGLGGVLARSQVRRPRGHRDAAPGIEVPLGGLEYPPESAWRLIVAAAEQFGPAALELEER